ncbi:N-acyl homoserine lactonase family protein [Mesorhizobium sp. BR1-1-16]|uniref:N-acyl homoserine lactonase family protein n=1 Tax=Mesorhizobium sp. BR1-1-16 TaxID=2876653 RepID=UPI001CCAA569|nr:N-acyl homoserine lactonase family protein [Mesorhizobium sp. BR1-1-16]MBZ9938409.1 N-acyl homoserine lactonase family protein [Mesorhizobium sp. BR1-1-16]
MTDVQALWEVHILEFARSKDQLVAGLILGAHDAGVVDLPFSFVLARRDDRVVLIDTGFMREGSGAAFSEKFGIPDWISPLSMLKALGVEAGDVTDIVLSHAHFDHMGSIGKFPNAMIHVQKQEILSWVELLALPPRFGGLTAIINPDDMRRAFDASIEHRLDLLDGDRDNLLPGLHVRTGPGHTIGQQFIILETARGRLVVAGDCIYTTANICGHNHDGVYVPLANAVGSTWDQLKTIDRINTEIGGDLSRLIILHDTARWAGLPVVEEIDGFRIVKAA